MSQCQSFRVCGAGSGLGLEKFLAPQLLTPPGNLTINVKLPASKSEPQDDTWHPFHRCLPHPTETFAATAYGIAS
eukprot:3121894-Rhodomonas_salina.1